MDVDKIIKRYKYEVGLCITCIDSACGKPTEDF